MALMPYRRAYVSPWSELRRLQGEFGDLLSDAFDAEGQAWMPAVEVRETADAIELTAELAGVKAQDVHVEVEDGVLTMRGEKNYERTSEDERRHIHERRYGSFTRSFTLPREIEVDEISASFNDGVLSVSVPKAERAKGRRIEIAAGSSDGEEVDVQ
ncbi:MAG TPA: Hsp20/alpha crystallin family protein [Longimicrobiales bacterium]|jgi:HSP20 family protein|nr:Hsp20/alpha crystallin family protein [Longimicrobiales bacterium]